MSSHVHFIFWIIKNQNSELLLGDFKRFTSRSVIKAIQENPKESRKEFLLEYFKKEAEKTSNTTNNQFWRHDNKPIELWSNEVIQQKLNYIHNNPVESGFVTDPIDWKYSSARNYGNNDQTILEIDINWFTFMGTSETLALAGNYYVKSPIIVN